MAKKAQREKIQGNISAKQVRELLKLGWVRDEALSERASEARILSDGRALMFLGEGMFGILFPSRDALAQERREAAEMMAKGATVNLPDTLLPPIADFIRDVEVHAASLSARIRVADEVLDHTDASLDAVDDALMRIRPAAKRMTPEIVTPLVAYVGDVMLRACGGRWTPGPTTRTRRVPIYEPGELAAWRAVVTAGQQSTREAEENAAARGASPRAVAKARHEALLAAGPASILAQPKPVGFKEIEEPVRGHENCPMVTARDGRLLDPFALVVVPMVEPSKRVPLRAAVDIMVRSYRPGFHSPPGTLLKPVARPMPPIPPAR